MTVVTSLTFSILLFKNKIQRSRKYEDKKQKEKHNADSYGDNHNYITGGYSYFLSNF